MTAKLKECRARRHFVASQSVQTPFFSRLIIYAFLLLLLFLFCLFWSLGEAGHQNVIYHKCCENINYP